MHDHPILLPREARQSQISTLGAISNDVSFTPIADIVGRDFVKEAKTSGLVQQTIDRYGLKGIQVAASKD
jgi:hypothetical protein